MRECPNINTRESDAILIQPTANFLDF
jgi:hypothetical protein